MRVLFLCKKRLNEYGVSFGLVNSASMIMNYLRGCGIECKVETVDDSNGIDRVVYEYKPSHVILHAIWVTPEKMEVLVRKYSKIIWNIRIHSKVPFIAHEGMAISWIIGYGKLMKDVDNLGMSGNSYDFVDAIYKSTGIDIDYLPNLYYCDTVFNNNGGFNDKYLHVGCFGAMRPFKNHLLQAMAAIHAGNRLGQDIAFHINGGRTEQGGQQVVKNLEALFNDNTSHKLINDEWRCHADFLELISRMDIGMQVSISETYNLVSADFVNVGTPILVSSEIYWMPWYSKADPMSIDSISNGLIRMYRLRGMANKIICRSLLRFDSMMAGKIWLKWLNGR